MVPRESPKFWFIAARGAFRVWIDTGIDRERCTCVSVRKCRGKSAATRRGNRREIHDRSSARISPANVTTLCSSHLPPHPVPFVWFSRVPRVFIISPRCVTPASALLSAAVTRGRGREARHFGEVTNDAAHPLWSTLADKRPSTSGCCEDDLVDVTSVRLSSRRRFTFPSRSSVAAMLPFAFGRRRRTRAMKLKYREFPLIPPHHLPTGLLLSLKLCSLFVSVFPPARPQFLSFRDSFFPVPPRSRSRAAKYTRPSERPSVFSIHPRCPPPPSAPFHPFRGDRGAELDK